MTFHDRTDPECRPVLSAAAAQMLENPWPADPAGRRKIGDALLAAQTATAPEGVIWDDLRVPGLSGEPDVPVRLYRPASAPHPGPGVLFIHGGGMWAGSIAHEHVQAATLSAALGAVVVSVGYRLAPEAPYPAAVHDCFGTLVWMAGHAGDLGFDPSRLAVTGGSAGGGLALAVALLARDRGGPALRYVMAQYPMIDDRSETASALEFDDLGVVWDRRKNVEAWNWYLAGQAADLYAAPARASTAQLAGLPPTFLDVGELDPFRDEDIAFATRLMQAGVPTELHVYPGAFHGSEHMVPDAELSVRIHQTRLAALRRALRPSPPPAGVAADPAAPELAR
ncbi:alpha/beta hydrolase [uncultured Deinococcus sp.]|uniref:alpha/beta hydrolase n=1 Tax=uncultured Deinococcus sp. TaxID=158789 RepID=UPI002584646B|nr:alpha/beta hydrolase [uncultured Deinococcus sp.]